MTSMVEENLHLDRQKCDGCMLGSDKQRALHDYIRAIDKELSQECIPAMHVMYTNEKNEDCNSCLLERLYISIDELNSARRLGKEPEIITATIMLNKNHKDEKSIIFSLVTTMKSKYGFDQFPCTIAALQKNKEETGEELPFQPKARIDEIVEDNKLKLVMIVVGMIKGIGNIISFWSKIFANLRSRRHIDTKTWKALEESVEKAADQTSSDMFQSIKKSTSPSSVLKNLIKYFIHDLNVIIRKEHAPIVLFIEEERGVENLGDRMREIFKRRIIQEFSENLSYSLVVVSSIKDGIE